ncbi:hypothetical protein Pla175_50960 [Pirellulimonas nuda]|uniref:Methanolan biosynthesis EpsI domain-containing protein n=1 Tax=Pirellulimonas nuda TaxID=2528009 RepID=A0A518DJP1_9BACT|nr:exosortase-associated EpsI family protein [Pirellulimonas nuda]QDU91666.1 hypothetical protein Pla175_50960 [Pirellulimonas nuda]
MLRYLPILLLVPIVVGLTLWEGMLSSRWEKDNVRAAECAKLIEQIPTNIGPWVGTDEVVEEEVLEGAGAVGAALSRVYENPATRQQVRVWLIVGHIDDISRHTPDVCNPSNGNQQFGEPEKVTMETPDGVATDFLTTSFGPSTDSPYANSRWRTFWSWFRPVEGEPVNWQVPQGKARWIFPNARAVYKLYLTAGQATQDEPAEISVCNEFAQEFMPVVNATLGKACTPGSIDDAAPAAADKAEGEAEDQTAEDETEA